MEVCVRHIELEDALKIRFASEPEEFDRGVEVGMVAALMAAGVASFERTVAPEVEEPVRRLAEKLGYRVLPMAVAGGRARLQLTLATRRPVLRVV
jgi:hypothetical protein